MNSKILNNADNSVLTPIRIKIKCSNAMGTENVPKNSNKRKVLYFSMKLTSLTN